MKKKLVLILLVVALVATMAVSLVACGDKETIEIEDGLSPKEALATILGYDIQSMTIETSSVYGNSTTKYTKDARWSQDTEIDKNVTYTYESYTVYENGKVYDLEADDIGTKDEEIEMQAIDLAGAKLTSIMFVEEGVEMLMEMFMVSIYESKYVNYDITTKDNMVIFTIIYDAEPTIYKVKDINNTTITVPEIFKDYQTKAEVIPNGCFQESENNVTLNDIRYGVETYRVPEKYNDKDVTNLNLYFSRYQRVKTLIIPKSIKTIESLSSFSKLKTIIYEGTKEEFEQISYYYPSYYDMLIITCQNGELTLGGQED